MTTKLRFLTLATAFASILVCEAAPAADDLVAPVYPNAVPAVLADGVQVDPFYTRTFGGMKALDCAGVTEARDGNGKVITAKQAEAQGYSSGPWCFLSRDPIDKVKAFYDKAVGPMHPIQGEHGEHGFIAFAERAWFPGSDEGAPGFGYSHVSIHALPPPPVLSNVNAPKSAEDGFEGQEAYKFYAQSHHFGMFVEGVDWFGDPSKRKPSELDALYKQYGHLESAFFQRKGAKLETADASLGEHYGQLREQRQKSAAMAPLAGLSQLSAAATQNDAGPTAEEDQQLNRIMQKNPALAQRYMALTQQVAALMAQGKVDEADEVLDQIDELEQSNPELAALNDQQQARSDQISAARQTQENAIVASGNKQMDEAIWGTALEYLKAVDAEDYYTLIVIENPLKGYEKDYSGDRSLIDADTAGWVEQADLSAWNVHYRQTEGASAAPASRAPADSGQAPAPADEQQTEEAPKEKVKKGLKALRGLL